MFEGLTDRQKEIIKVSLEIISEKGIQGLTIKNIAVKTGTVESAVYRHFSGKIDILHAVLDIIKKNSLPETYKDDTNTVTQIEQTLRSHFKTFDSFPALVAVFFSEDMFQSNNILADRTKDIMQTSMNKMMKIIKNGQKKGELRSDIKPEHLAAVIAGTFRTFVKQWRMSDYEFNLVQKGEELINSVKILIKPCA
ncbi:MAG: TetR/AcrR family transcriptional regulator [Chlorobi bacterium]|nr:TetR/AcrR family transcriptional regulator [Chlorobiota bacterium]